MLQRARPTLQALGFLAILGLSAVPSGARMPDAGVHASAAPAPAAPTNLRLVTVSFNEVGLEWDDNSNNETDFQVEVRTWDDSFRLAGLALDPTGLTEDLQPDTLYIFRVRARNAAGASRYTNELAVSTQALPSTCVPAAESLCLRNNRFKVKAYWESEQGGRGRGQAVQLTAESGYFWFFNQDNVEVLIKLLNGCVPNFRYWMFAAGLTDQRVIWTATDTQTGYVKTYQNPLKTQFAPALDVDFAPCP